MSRIYPAYILDISGLYAAYIREIPAFAMPIPILGRAVDRDHLNIKTQPLWQDKSQALVSQVLFTTFLPAKEGYGYHHHPLHRRAFKRMIKSKPSFDLTRRNNKEFGGRSTASKCIRRVLHPLKPLSVYNISGPLNSTLRPCGC
jgi:hypothetical protein